jgi:hypothetical protein
MSNRRITTNKVNRILINGVEPTNTKVIEFSSNFTFDQCFCSCSLRHPYPYHLVGTHWTTVEEHYPDCPNADPKRFVDIVRD